MSAKHRPYWVIVAGTTPTAFRSRRRESLVPTLRQLQRTQPDSALMWFERGRLWPSEDEARSQLAAQRRARAKRVGERSTDWRPGGGHKDPKARPKLSRDERRARFKKRTIKKRRSASTPAASASGSAPSRNRKDSGPARRSGGLKK